jgi:CheY-like chemotaxis protein
MSRVLVVEDESGIRSLLVALLKEEGYDVVATGDGRAAVALLREHQPDLILLDVMLPGMDGREVFEQLRATEGLAETPVIFMSAAPPLQLAADARTSFISKPFELDRLLAAVERWLPLEQH